MTEDLLAIPHAFCQECRLCCRFIEQDRQTPFSSRPGLRPILPDVFRGKTDPDLTLVRIDEFDLWQCSLLDPSSWNCSSWPNHPLDCKIYPLVLILHEGSPWLGIDTNCPFSLHISREILQQKASAIKSTDWARIPAPAKSALIVHLEKEGVDGVVPILSLED